MGPAQSCMYLIGAALIPCFILFCLLFWKLRNNTAQEKLTACSTKLTGCKKIQQDFHIWSQICYTRYTMLAYIFRGAQPVYQFMILFSVKVSLSLLLLSQAFMLPDTTTTTEKLVATISALPDTVVCSYTFYIILCKHCFPRDRWPDGVVKQLSYRAYCSANKRGCRIRRSWRVC